MFPRCFNGATTFQSWIDGCQLCEVFESACMFQWSHDFSVMDRADKSGRRGISIFWFQWSHDFSVMDSEVLGRMVGVPP